MSNGPFVFAEWVTGSYLRFVKNQNYWKDVWFDEVVLNFYSDVSVLEQLMVAGELDMTRYILPASRAAELVAANDFLDVRTSFGGVRLELEYNQGPNGHPALKDQRVRHAMSMGIDRQFMVDEIYNGIAEVANTWWAGTPWYNPDALMLPFDPAGAVGCCAKRAGMTRMATVSPRRMASTVSRTGCRLKSPRRPTLTFSTIKTSLLYVQDVLADIGIKMNITLHTSPKSTARSPITARWRPDSTMRISWRGCRAWRPSRRSGRITAPTSQAKRIRSA
ncbi:MAG: hypothetical protein HND48_02505 [Chloroflexi bacterium]|nr:hypothetical protein [Chloroflexota bacterium]